MNKNIDTPIVAATRLIEKLELGQLRPLEAEQLVVDIFQAAGFTVRAGFAIDRAVDVVFNARLQGIPSLVAAVFKYYRDPLPAQPLLQFLRATDSEEWSKKLLESQSATGGQPAAKIHRILISQSGFSPSALRAAADWLDRFDILSPTDLKRWIAKLLSSELEEAEVERVDVIMRAAMVKIARTLATYPEELFKVEWRTLEAALREVFEGLNFETRLTRSAKDVALTLNFAAAPQGHTLLR